VPGHQNHHYPPQQYPPGTQEHYDSFLSRDLMMGKGKELEFPEGPGGGKGEQGVPPNPPGTHKTMD